MSEKIDKKYDFLYKSIQETNDYNAKYCSCYKSFFSKQPEDNIDYIKLIIELNLIKKNVGEMREKIEEISTDTTQGSGKIGTLFNDLDAYQQLIMASAEQFAAILINVRRKLNNIERYGRFAYKRDLNQLNDLDARRSKLQRALTDMSVTFKNRHLKKPKRNNARQFKVIVNDTPKP